MIMASIPIVSQLLQESALGNGDSVHKANYTEHDRSVLCDIDPDLNYYYHNNSIKSEYYTEKQFNNTFSDNNNLSILHLNIRSVPLHFSEFLCYLDTLDLEFKIIALSETGINNHHAVYNITHYNLEMDHRHKRRGGGVSLYIHNILQYKIRKDLVIGDVVNSVFIEIIRSSTNTKNNVICGCVYRPPFMSVKFFNELLELFFSKLQSEKKYVYITGDFNVNILTQPNCSLATQDFKNIFSSNFYSPLIQKPTRITEHSATLIDNIYCNVPELSSNSAAGILKVSISDHYAIFCILKYATIQAKTKIVKKRNFGEKNIATFTTRLNNENWDFVFMSECAQSAFSRFQSVIDLHFSTVFKMQTRTINYKNRHPWMTDALRAQIKLKNVMHSRAITLNNKATFENYNRAKNMLKSSLRNAEIQYYSHQLEMHKTDISKSWKILKNIIGKHSCRSRPTMHFNINNESVSNSTDIAESFNIFFVSIGPQLAENISCETNPLTYVNNIERSIVILDVTCEKIKGVIHSLNNSSSGWDEIPTFLVKKCVDSFIEPLTYLVNSSISEGIFPSELKLARVVPIFKSGDPSLITNYRPISVLSFFSKVFEKVMYNHIISFMNKNDVLYDQQFGFRQKYSTQQAIIMLVDKITRSLDAGDIVISVFLDLKKAFDTVDHHILLKKLYAYGIRGKVLKWFHSYLFNRSQYVIYDDMQSETHHVKCGVPQGSIMGPLLFIIYMNDICNVSKFLYTILYADDTCVLLNGKDLNNLIQSMNTELDLLSTWLKSNKLSLNTHKTFFQLFHRARIKTNNSVNIIVDKCVLNKVTSIKYLGVIIDHKLNWIEHISYVKNKISKGIGILYKARQFLEKRDLLNLYYSYIYPYLIYCIEIWGCAAKSHMNPLYLTQKKIIRIITFSHYISHTQPLFQDLSILPLEKLVLYRIALIMYKISNCLIPKTMSDLYITNKDIHSYDTRYKNLFRIPKGTINYTSLSARLWNILNMKIDVHVPLSQFKSSVVNYLVNNTTEIKYSK